jgi:hypothetical protein
MSNVHPYVTENPTCRKKMIGTLTSGILKSAHTLISPISFDKLCSVATSRHSNTLPLPNHLRIVALPSDLERVSIYSIIKFLYHSSTIKLLLLLILIKWLYLSLKALVLRWKSRSALWLLWHANLYKDATRVGTAVKRRRTSQ